MKTVEEFAGAEIGPLVDFGTSQLNLKLLHEDHLRMIRIHV